MNKLLLYSFLLMHGLIVGCSTIDVPHSDSDRTFNQEKYFSYKKVEDRYKFLKSHLQNLLAGTGIKPSPLGTAVALHDVEMVDFLLANGYDVNEKNPSSKTTILDCAVGNPNNIDISIVKKILAAGADYRLSEGNPLVFACESGNIEIVRLLLDAGLPVNKPAVNGYFPLFVTKNIEIAKLLINHGADVNIISSGCKNRTALSFAIYRGEMALISLLIEKGADPNILFIKDELSKTKATILDLVMEIPGGKNNAGVDKEEIIMFLRKNGAKTKTEIEVTKPPPETNPRIR